MNTLDADVIDIIGTLKDTIHDQQNQIDTLSLALNRIEAHHQALVERYQLHFELRSQTLANIAADITACSLVTL